MQRTETIRLDRIDPDPSNRQVGDVGELAKNMAKVGLLNPILVVPTEGGRYRIVAGERRYRAAARLGWPVVECRVRDSVGGEAEEMAVRISENVERKKLSPVEEASMVAELAARQGGGIGEVAAQLGKGEKWVRSRMKLVRLDVARLREAGIDLDGASIKALEIFSDLPAERQAEVLDGHAHAFADALEMAAFAEGAAMPLEGAIFDAGECAKCPHNTANEPTLFADDAACTRPGCWKRKAAEAVCSRAAAVAEKGEAWVYVAADIPADWAAEARRARVELLGQPKSRWVADPEGDTAGIVFCGQGQGETVRVRRTVADSFEEAKARARALGIKLPAAPLKDRTKKGMLEHVLKWGAAAFRADGWKGEKGDAETLVRALTLKARRDYLREGMRTGEEDLLRRMAEVERELDLPGGAAKQKG